MKTYRFKFDPSLDFLPPEELRVMQTLILREHLQFCSQYSPYYKRLFGNRDWSRFTPDRLPELPLTEKCDIAKDPEDFQASPWRDVMDVVFSSGTTGLPAGLSIRRATWSGSPITNNAVSPPPGMTPDDKVLLTCTLDRCFVAGMAYYQGVCRLGASAIRNGLNTLESHAEVIRTLRPSMIVGVPSFLRHLGKHLGERGVSVDSVRALICIGEPVHDEKFGFSELGGQLRELWNARIHSTYASSEIVSSFCDCTECCGGHLRADLASLKSWMKTGNVLPPGETGEVVITPMQVTGMPLVRFRTGDISFMTDEPCRCGRFLPRLGPILGRKAQMLKIRGTTLYPQALFSVLDSSPEVLEYYIVATGHELSDRIEAFVALKEPHSSLEAVSERLKARCRLTVPVIGSADRRGAAPVFSFPASRVRFIRPPRKIKTQSLRNPASARAIRFYGRGDPHASRRAPALNGD